MIAVGLKRPEVALTEAESKQLASAMVNVTKHYELDVLPKQAAWAELIMAIGIIYAPRIVAIARKPQKKAKEVESDNPAFAAGDNVHPMFAVQ